MTHIVYLGAEVPSNRLLLDSMRVKRMGFSFWRAYKRGLPKKKDYYLSDHFDPDVDIFVDWWSPLYAELGFTEQQEYDAAYLNFLLCNADSIYASTHHESMSVGHTICEWNGKGDLPNADIIGIPGEVIDSNPSIAARVRLAKATSDTRFLAQGTAKPDNLRQVPFDFASTLAWLSPMRRGETIIWDGRSLMRYPKSMQSQARKRYMAQVNRAGLSYDKFVADDNKEVAKVTIWSFMQLEEDLNRKRGILIVDNSDNQHGDETGKSDLVHVDNKVPEVVNETVLLPGLTASLTASKKVNEDGEQTTVDVPVLSIDATSLRQCNTCFVAATCPAFERGSACKFKIPVEIRTPEQLKATFTALTEMQMQRILFARFAEEQNGGYPDPNLSQEMDRMLAQLAKIKAIESENSSVKVTVEASGPGMLAQIFGEQAKKPELPQRTYDEDQTSLLMAEILDAEIVE